MESRLHVLPVVFLSGIICQTTVQSIRASASFWLHRTLYHARFGTDWDAHHRHPPLFHDSNFDPCQERNTVQRSGPAFWRYRHGLVVGPATMPLPPCSRRNKVMAQAVIAVTLMRLRVAPSMQAKFSNHYPSPSKFSRERISPGHNDE